MSYWYNRTNLPVEERAQVLLSQIKKVAKLVTVEGHFIEYYDYSEPESPLFIGPMLNYRALLPLKSAKLRIKGRVLVGYDLERMQIQSFPSEKRILIQALPQAEILAIEHQIDQFDNESSIFRPLSSDDYASIDRGAQQKIRQLAEQSELMDSAKQQGNELIDLMRFLVENAGWTLEIAPSPGPLSAPDSLLQ